ncbi:NlpC/P60 family protein [Geobacter sp. SVR]|uniref:NlpC/P60 family protein n=1 Tax=Geobacter sp. SVR TaxID=2495594 RepID=UPI0015669FB7|nr:NlpC/P60 family protein [Geobacter sp. SVR]
MIKYLIILIVALSCARPFTAEGAAGYGTARSAAPVLNTPEIDAVFGSRDGRSLQTDRCGQVRALEFIALPGTPFRLLAEVKRGENRVYRVETDDYPVPAGTALYVDSRLIERSSTPPPPRPRHLPAREEIIVTMKTALGSPYVWGGNLPQGVPGMLGLYYRGQFPEQERERLALAGLDCSGLLYWATNGWTPRNTSDLVAFGRGVAVAGRGAAELAAMLQPLDLIVWNGHVVIVLDSETVIESRLECGRPGNGGVVATPLKQRIQEIMRNRRPADAWPEGKQRGMFVVRRWFGNS